jgi:carbamoyltransferase
MDILGLNAFHGDASAALLRDGQLVAAVEEERLNRIKHWAGLPVLAAKACLQGAQPDHIAISRNPKTHLADKLARVALRPQRWLSLRSRAANIARIAHVGRELAAEGIQPQQARQIHFVEHHRAHLASAFFASPFEEAAVISIDGFGDFSSVTPDSVNHRHLRKGCPAMGTPTSQNYGNHRRKARCTMREQL